jgi:hypothetical protein
MGKIVAGTFNGTGAALYLGIGFVPDWVKVYNLEDADLAMVEWNRHCRSIEQEEGRLIQAIADNGTTGTKNIAALVQGAGIAPYLGGDKMTAASTAYLVKDDRDFSKNPAGGGTGIIDTWTLGSSSNKTGNFNKGVDTTYVGEGSVVIIREGVSNGKIYEARMTALTNDGDAANEVELSLAIGSGTVLAIKGAFDYRGAASGVIVPAGFAINATTVINVSGELCFFEAGQYDN